MYIVLVPLEARPLLEVVRRDDDALAPRVEPIGLSVSRYGVSPYPVSDIARSAYGQARELQQGSRAVLLDHLILPVNDVDPSVSFYEDILGFTSEGTAGPFTVLRVTPDLTLQLAPWGTSGGVHLAFSMSKAEFDERFAHIQAAGIRYGDSFHTVGNQQGPGREDGAHGSGASLYVFDPNEHLIELRHYEPD